MNYPTWKREALASLNARQTQLMAEHNEIEAIKNQLKEFGNGTVTVATTPTTPVKQKRKYTRRKPSVTTFSRLSITEDKSRIKRLISETPDGSARKAWKRLRKEGYTGNFLAFSKMISRMTMNGQLRRVGRGFYVAL